MNAHQASRSLLLLCGLALTGGCNNESRGYASATDTWPDVDLPEDTDSDGPPADLGDLSSEIDDYVLSLGYVELAPEVSRHEIPCDPLTMTCVAPWKEGDLDCQMKYYEATVHHDRFPALQPDDPLLWPGALIRGRHAGLGLFSAVGLERAPATFSFSLENLVESPSATMDIPSLSEFRRERNDILRRGSEGSTPANISYEVHKITDRVDISRTIGVSVDWESNLDLDSMFDFGNQSKQHRYLFDLNQTYYAIDLDTPTRPSSVFGPEVTVENLQGYMGPGDPPLLVQSVVFGRRVLFAIETDRSMSDVVGAVSTAFGGLVALSADSHSFNILDSSRITAAILGGNAEGAISAIQGVEQFVEFISRGGNYSADSPGIPIGYRLAYLDGSTVRLAVTLQYSEPECH